MSKFKPGQITVEGESKVQNGQRIVKVDKQLTPDVKAFEFNKIKHAHQGSYNAVRAKFGALAVTDADRAARTRKDERFVLNPIVRDRLSIEEEERRVIEAKVAAQVGAIVEEARSQASAKGFEEGFDRGKTEAFAKYVEEGRGRLERFEKLIGELESAREDIFRANERYLVELVFRLSRMLLLKELAVDREYATRLCKHLIERVGVRDNIRIKISPEDVSGIDQLKSQLFAKFGELKNLQIEASPQVNGGGCMIETDWNAIDASVETQLQGLFAALIGPVQEL